MNKGPIIKLNTHNWQSFTFKPLMKFGISSLKSCLTLVEMFNETK